MSTNKTYPMLVEKHYWSTLAEKSVVEIGKKNSSDQCRTKNLTQHQI